MPESGSMPKVDFYTIAKTTEDDRLRFACRLTEKAWSLGHKVYIHTDSEAMAQEMDNLLWEFNPESFVPHAIDGIIDDEEVPVLIGFAEQFSGPKDVLLNLSRDIPPFHAEFQRISEVVIDDQDIKKFSREHWQAYKTLGYELEHHEL